MSVGSARNTVSTRLALEGAIGDLLEKHSDLVHITSDGVDYVNRCRDRRFDVGIAESNLINIATGFALKNHRVVVNGIASFVLYNAYLQVRNNISHHNLSVVIIGIGAGLSYGHLGATHHAPEDIACLYTLPNMNIYLPVDGLEASGMLKEAVEKGGPAYIRIRNGQEPVVSNLKEYSRMSNYNNPVTLNDNHESNILIICYGATVIHSLRAARTLNEQGVPVNVLSIRILSRTSIDEVAFQAKKYKHIVVVEEHYEDTGVGSILNNKVGMGASIIGIRKKVEHIGGLSDGLLARYGLDADSIIMKIKDMSQKEDF